MHKIYPLVQAFSFTCWGQWTLLRASSLIQITNSFDRTAFCVAIYQYGFADIWSLTMKGLVPMDSDLVPLLEKNPVTFTSTIKLHTKNVLFIDTWGFRIWVASPGQMPSPKLSFLLEFEVLLQYYDSWNTWVYPAQLKDRCWKIDR